MWGYRSKAHKFFVKKMFANENLHAFKVAKWIQGLYISESLLNFGKINISADLNEFNFKFLKFSYKKIYELSNGIFTFLMARSVQNLFKKKWKRYINCSGFVLKNSFLCYISLCVAKQLFCANKLSFCVINDCSKIIIEWCYHPVTIPLPSRYHPGHVRSRWPENG